MPSSTPADRCVPRRLAPSLTPLASALCLALPALAFAQASPAPAQDLATVTVTATLQEHDTRTAPASVSIVDRARLDQQQPADLFEAVRGQTGIGFNATNTAGRRTLSMRGMDGKHVLTMVDGKRIAATDDIVGHSNFQFGWVPMAAVERVEIIRGPMSTLYGSEALGGVINMVTRQPRGDRWETSIYTKAGTQTDRSGGNLGQASIYTAGKVNDMLSLRLSGTAAHADAIAKPSNPSLSAIEGQNNAQGSVGGTLKINADHSLDFNLMAGKERRFFDTSKTVNKLPVVYESDYDLARRQADVTWKGQFGGWKTQARAYGSDIRITNSASKGVAPATPQRMQEKVIDGFASTRFGAHQFTTGAELRRESLTHSELNQGSDSATHKAVFAQDEWALTPSLSLTTGLRADHHALFGSEFSPRAYLVWEASPALVVKGGLGHAFKAPTLKQMSGNYHYNGASYDIYGNPDLKPESLNSIELGATWQPTSALELQATLFHNDVKNLIASKIIGPKVNNRNQYWYSNVDKARITGLELGANWDISRQWRWSNNATFMATKDLTTGNRLDYRPRVGFNSAVDWNGQDGWNARLDLNYTGSQVAASVPLPAFSVWNVSLGKKLNKTYTVRAGLDNIGNVDLAEKSADFKNAERGRTLFVSLQADF